MKLRIHAAAALAVLRRHPVPPLGHQVELAVPLRRRPHALNIFADRGCCETRRSNISCAFFTNFGAGGCLPPPPPPGPGRELGQAGPPLLSRTKVGAPVNSSPQAIVRPPESF
jgi:hypothetical protein